MSRKKPPAESPDEFVASSVESPESAKVKALEAENARLSKLLGLVESHSAGLGTPPSWARSKTKSSMAAIACLQLSDLHLDEFVDPAEVGGLNAYSRPIAEMRLRRWAAKAVELGDRFKHDWQGAVLFWGGDMVSGSIHEELRETNEDDLPGTMTHWAPLLASAIRTVADFYGAVHIPCVVGNHGRLTKERPFKRRGRNSWDFLLSSMVKGLLSDDRRITWDIAQGSYLIVPLYEDNAFLTHGDEVGGGSGWSGIWTPLSTAHRKGSELAACHGKRVAYSVIGHWHSLTLAHARGISCNGSLKGADQFCLGLRLKPEPAMQAWWAHTARHGVTVAAPVFCEDRAKEGW